MAPVSAWESALPPLPSAQLASGLRWKAQSLAKASLSPPLLLWEELSQPEQKWVSGLTRTQQ